MKATEAKLLAFLQKSPQFVIPIYQRTYSWTDKQCRQLWDDILRDSERVPLLEDGGPENDGTAAFIRREVLSYTPAARIKEDSTKIGYEVSFTRHFYKPQPLRTLEEISAGILAIEKETEGLLEGLLVGEQQA